MRHKLKSTEDIMIDVGVVIGRFQTDKLTDGHKHLLKTALRKTQLLVVLVAESLGQPDKKNPLSVNDRKTMLYDYFLKHNRENRVIVSSILDVPGDDAEWSKRVDGEIASILLEQDNVVIFHGRDTPVSSAYSGRYKLEEVPEISAESATDRRANVSSEEQLSSKAFRAGKIAALNAQFDKVHPTVDVALWTYSHTMNQLSVLVGQKPTDEGRWRLIGGFVDTTDASYEHAAQRELLEETGIAIDYDRLIYAGSVQIDDKRYRFTPHQQIMSILFECACTHQEIRKFADEAVAQDDISAITIIDFKTMKGDWDPSEFNFEMIVPEHRLLFRKLFIHLFYSGLSHV